MSEQSDLVKLYSGRILSLAAAIPRIGQLAEPDASVKKRSPLCGSTVRVDLKVDGGRITDYAQDVKACALGQAAASVVAAHAIGRSVSEIHAARDQLKAMLKDGGPAPEAPFDELGVLLPARDFKNRHASILLALEATLEAFEEADRAACA